MDDRWRDFQVLLAYTVGCMIVLAAYGALNVNLAILLLVACAVIGAMMLLADGWWGWGWGG